jgi:glycosyltransferase involved in cell wall biosynthesis
MAPRPAVWVHAHPSDDDKRAFNLMSHADNPLPTVSVIMPVYGCRNGLVAAAVQSYLNQDYPNKQLVVVDDSPEELRELFVIAGLTEGSSDLVYIRSNDRMTVGGKRNLACAMSSGDIFCHMDSDDLSSPNRISSQVSALLSSGKPVTGYHTLPLFDLLTNHVYLYHYNSRYCCGASLCYLRSHWERNPFPERNVGEDEGYCIRLGDRHQLHTTDGSRSILIMLHDDNISTRRQVEKNPQYYKPVSANGIPPHIFSSHSDLFLGYDAVVN